MVWLCVVCALRPEPVDVSSLEQLKPLYDWLGQQKRQQATPTLFFCKGAVTDDGRLDLCKQVGGGETEGLQPGRTGRLKMKEAAAGRQADPRPAILCHVMLALMMGVIVRRPQVVGPGGIGPLLESLARHQHIDRLLLGNNIIGDQVGPATPPRAPHPPPSHLLWSVCDLSTACLD